MNTEKLPTPEPKRPPSQIKILARHAMRLYRNRPSSIEVGGWVMMHWMPIVGIGAVATTAADLLFNLRWAAHMAQVQPDPDAHFLVQIGQELVNDVGETAKELEIEFQRENW